MRPASPARRSRSRTAAGKRTLASRKTRKMAGNTARRFLGLAETSALAVVVADLLTELCELAKRPGPLLVPLLLVAQ